MKQRLFAVPIKWSEQRLVYISADSLEEAASKAVDLDAGYARDGYLVLDSVELDSDDAGECVCFEMQNLEGKKVFKRVVANPS